MIRMARNIRPLAITVAAISAGLLIGYLYVSGRNPSSVEWDLSRSHTKSDVDWSSKSSSTWEIPDTEYDTKLPGGLHLMGKRMLRLDADPGTGRIGQVSIVYPNMTTDEAYRAARELARELSLETVNLDRWYKERSSGGEAGEKDLTSTTGMSPAEQAPGSPAIHASLLYSFDHEKPTFIDLSFYWPEPER
ncbi:hypothetical protein [Streptomyces sp. AB3(2024)]|uniref:hypothetical protein n=1 Tax=Streptomyces sp. AB3(2024) TaxID=3317321 RepID=UPI0035A2A98D